jgi:hypothetical protein
MLDQRLFFHELDNHYWRLAMETAIIGRDLDRLAPSIDTAIKLRPKDTDPGFLDALKGIRLLAKKLSEYTPIHERYGKAREQFLANHDDATSLETMLEELKTRTKNPFMESYIDKMLQKQVPKIREMLGDPTFGLHLDRVPDKGGE